MPIRGRPYRLTEEYQAHLKSIVADHPVLTLEELRNELQRHTRLEAHVQTIKKSLDAACGYQENKRQRKRAYSAL